MFVIFSMHRILLSILFTTSLFAKDIIAILDLETIGLNSGKATILTQRLTTKLISIGIYEVVERANMDKILKEQKFQKSGCTDSECAVEIGQLLNTDFIVMGSVNKFGSTWTLDARLIDVGLGKGIISAEYTMKGEIDGLITTGITSIAQQLSGMGSNEFMTELSYPVSGTKTLSKEKAVISFPPRVIKSHIVLSPLHLGVQSDTYHAVCVSFSGSMSGSRNDTSFDGLGTVEKNSYRTRAMLSYFIKNNHFGYDLGFGSGSIYRYYVNDGERILDDIHLDLQMYRLGIYYFFYDNNIVSVFAKEWIICFRPPKP